MSSALIVAASTLAACSSHDDGEASEGDESALVSSVNVLTSRFDTARTGANKDEKILTPANVTPSTFGKVFERVVDGQIYAQPLYVGGVNGKNLVFVATEHNSVYAFNADDKRANGAPIWQKNFGPSVPAEDTGCKLLTPEIGITATPVIDVAAKTIWFTAKSKENGAFIHRLHALDIATGLPRANSPVVITATAPGDGAASENGVITMDPLKHLQRTGLLKVGNAIYLGFASHCDIAPYHGWVLGYDATTLKQTAVHVDTPSGSEGGIWHGGVGLAADDNGDVYYTSGNGTFDGVKNFGNSVVRLKPGAAGGFTVGSFFTPFDSSAANSEDLDLGSTGALLIPGTQLLATGDKRGLTFLVDRNKLGGIASKDSQIKQRFQATTRGMYGGAAFLKQGPGGTYYLWGTGDRLKAFHFDGAQFVNPPQVNAGSLVGYPGGQLSVSADGDKAGSGILWAVTSKRAGAGLASSAGAGVLHAFDANDVTRKLWASDARPTDELSAIAKFAPPTIANGRVYIGTAANLLIAYGLLGDGAAGGAPANAKAPAPAPPPPQSGPAPTWTKVYDDFFGPGTTGHCSGVRGCHVTIRGGFNCGQSKTECFAGLVQAGLVTPADPTNSPIAVEGQSPLSWFGGRMPADNAIQNQKARDAVTAWVAAGAKNN